MIFILCCSQLQHILCRLSVIDNHVMGDLKMMALEAAFQTFTSTNKMIMELKVRAKTYPGTLQ
jgi:hypothetical protein